MRKIFYKVTKVPALKVPGQDRPERWEAKAEGYHTLAVGQTRDQAIKRLTQQLPSDARLNEPVEFVEQE